MKARFDPLDRLALGVIAGLIAAIAVVILAGDHVGVPIRDVQPARGSTPAITSVIAITFGESVIPESAESRLVIEPAVDGRIEWIDPTRLVLRPEAPLSPGVTYRATLRAGVESTTGRQMARGLSWEFTPRTQSILYLAPADVDVRHIWTLDPDNPAASPETVYSAPYGVIDFAPSPDGEQIALTQYTEQMLSNIWLIKRDGSDPKLLLDCNPGLCTTPTWSPDGQLIADQRQEPAPGSSSMAGPLGPSRVWILDMETKETAPLMQDNQVLGFSPTWSPDGSRIAFFDSNGGAIRILSLDPARSSSILLSSLMGEVGAFSPDGGSMIYTDLQQVGQQYYAQFWIARFDEEQAVTRLFDEPFEEQWPAWSPDGKLLAFGRRALDRQGGRGHQFWLHGTLTGERTRVTTDTRYNNLVFLWDATSSRVLFRRFNLEINYPQSELWLY
ncbi:MAG: PD40 domain-containing protein, partial [Anaerolineae bacterium]|nr:PD40 domain-containing protein [Anaerolineae bacterium]